VVDSVEREIRELRALFWSDRDPEGRAFVSLADAYRRMGELDQALELLVDGLGRHADFAPGHVVAGWVRRARGEGELAQEAFRSALALDDENTEALRGLAEVADERGEAALAADCRRRLAELEPGVNGDAPSAAVALPPPTFEDAAFEAPVFDAAAGDRVVEDPWGGDAEIVSSIDEAAPGADDMVLTADDIVVDTGEPAATEAVIPGVPEEAAAAPIQAAAPEPFAEAPPAPVTEADPWAAPVRAAADDEDGPVTRTMADLYARQNLHERALRIYRRLLERTPGDAGLADRVQEMETRIAAEAVGTDAHPVPIAELAPAPIESAIEPPAAPPAEPPDLPSVEPQVEPMVAMEPPAMAMDAAPAATDTPRAPLRAPARPPRRGADADVETLARDWAEGPGDTGELSTPFAWATRPAQPSVPAAGVGRPIGDYFRGLLAWEPGMQPEPAAPAKPVAEAAPMEVAEPVAEAAPMEVAEPAAEAASMEAVEPVAEAAAMGAMASFVEAAPTEAAASFAAPAPMELDEPVAEAAPMQAIEPLAEVAAPEVETPEIAEPFAEPVADVVPAEPAAVEAAAPLPIVAAPVAEVAPPAPAATARVVVPVEALAPDGRSERVVPIESLLATIVDIAALAPHVVDVATLAPDRPAGTGASGWMDPVR
jgi:tetratricopeptide (TPR) repeat protein